MAKRIMAVLLAVLLVLSLAACGSSANSGNTEDSSAENVENTANAEDDLREPELVTLDIVTMASGREESGIAEVEEAMNAILEAVEKGYITSP